MLVNSVPLSETIVFGIPRSATTRSSSRATRWPDNDVSATSTRFSRLKSSTTARMRKRRPSVSASDTKSNDQRWFGPSVARSCLPANNEREATPSAFSCPMRASCRLCGAPEASLRYKYASPSCDSRQNLPAQSSHEYDGNQTVAVLLKPA